MNPTSRWHKLFHAIICWWKNAPCSIYLSDARLLLKEYDALYGRRTQPESNTQWGQQRDDVLASYRAQAASFVQNQHIQRSPGIESEVRVLAILLERLVTYLEQRT